MNLKNLLLVKAIVTAVFLMIVSGAFAQNQDRWGLWSE